MTASDSSLALARKCLGMHTFLWDLEGQQDVPLARVNDVVGDLAALIDQVRQERDDRAVAIAEATIGRVNRMTYGETPAVMAACNDGACREIIAAIRAAATAPAPEDPK